MQIAIDAAARNDVPAPRRKSRLLGVFLALILAGGTFFTGLMIGQEIPRGGESESRGAASIFSLFTSAASPEPEVDLDPFWDVWKILDQKFITTATTTLTTEQKVEGAIKGLVEAYGDPYTVFLPPADTAALEEDISGNFSGVGMEVGLRDGVVTIIAPLPETPAERAGLLTGDKIITIDGVTTEGMRIDEAVRRIRGEKDTTVTLEIFREGELEFREVSMVRDNITIPTVDTEVLDDAFLIKLYSFNALSEMKMQEALTAYKTSGKRRLIIDLRGNPGGLLQSAVSIAGFMLPSGKVVVREQFGEGKEERLYRSQGRLVKDFAPGEIVVLVDTGSASASEILAGALKEHGLATLIGLPTFGKGSVQELVPLEGSASLKITIARWLTPNGVSISEGGLQPDIRINRTPQQRLEGVDPQQDAALRFIRGEAVESEAVTE